jgi:nicotinamide-nucleotide amidase
MARLAIMSIGDELCIGQVVNTNAAWIAQQCSELGFEVFRHVTVGDDRDEIVAELRRLWERSDGIITTGGLGPTHDDLTVEALCEFLGEEAIEHPEVRARLEELVQQRGIAAREQVLRQAWIPRSAIPLPNPVGQAPGIWVEREGKFLLALPGVPAEMRSILERARERLRSFRLQRGGAIRLSRTLLTAGIAEADLAALLGEPAQLLPEGVRLAFLPSFTGVRLRLDARAESPAHAEVLLEQALERLRERIDAYLVGEGAEASLAQAVGTLLRQRRETLAVAESCTAGLLGAAITEVAGSSEYFLGGLIVYSNAAKVELLSVPPELLERVGAVSREVAELLAQNVRQRFAATYGVGITGIAGPGGGTPEKPVGTVWIALATPQGVQAQRYWFRHDRAGNRQRAVAAALTMLFRHLRALSPSDAAVHAVGN